MEKEKTLLSLDRTREEITRNLSLIYNDENWEFDVTRVRENWEETLYFDCWSHDSIERADNIYEVIDFIKKNILLPKN